MRMYAYGDTVFLCFSSEKPLNWVELLLYTDSLAGLDMGLLLGEMIELLLCWCNENIDFITNYLEKNLIQYLYNFLNDSDNIILIYHNGASIITINKYILWSFSIDPKT